MLLYELYFWAELPPFEQTEIFIEFWLFQFKIDATALDDNSISIFLNQHLKTVEELILANILGLLDVGNW